MCIGRGKRIISHHSTTLAYLCHVSCHINKNGENSSLPYDKYVGAFLLAFEVSVRKYGKKVNIPGYSGINRMDFVSTLLTRFSINLMPLYLSLL
jgi:hypothetical protein